MSKPTLSINKEIKPYLDDIAEKMWTNHATIMVGAGFSKNASSKFPDWNQLGDVFYEKIYGTPPTPENTKYRNVLKLADEVEAAFSRPTLHHILMNEIPNISVEPAQLHQDLLMLPWVDVFTTNYDTLLERAAEKVSARRYDVVVNCQELVYSSSPRIIKLHGSFPSTTPFIITEEDYRKYPSDFAPYVNTVQQALLENTLCLIGFSGDDPNFLKWIGWIRDNLGTDNSPPIYLIGLFNLTNAELKLLSNRNIVVINMGLCEGINTNDHGKALELFFNYLKSKNTSLESFNWPRNINLPSPDRREENESIENQVIKFTKKIHGLKKSYPGWVIAPHEARRKLKQGVGHWLSFITSKDALKTDVKIGYLEACIWVSNTCLQPIYDDQAKVIEDFISILDGYSPNDSSIDESIVFIKLSLCRYYRDEYKWNSWENLIVQLNKLKNTYSTDINENISYECCLGAFHKLELSKLECLLKEWLPKTNSPLWLLRKAALMAEYGNLDDAIILSQEALTNIRTKLNLSPIKSDVSLLSLESYAMVLFRYTSNAEDFTKRDVFADFSERWDELKQYKCDPWAELEYFDLLLQKQYQEPVKEVVTPSFDIGVFQTTTNNGDDPYALNAVSYLRLYEDSGLPIKLQHTTINSKTLGNALNAIGQYYPLWAIFVATRLADHKVVKSLLGRKGLFRLSSKNADVAADIYLSTFKGLQKGVSSHKGRLQRNLYDRFATIIPEVLSRLMSRLTFNKISEIYQFTCEIFGSDTFCKYDGLDRILKRAPQMVSETEATSLFSYALKCQCPTDTNINIRNLFPPVWDLNLTKSSPSAFTNNDFDYWLTLVNDTNKMKKKWGFYTLAKLYDANLFNEIQSEKFAKALWQNVKSDHLPKFENILDSAYLSLPAIISQDKLKEITKNKIFSLVIPIRANNKSYEGTQGHIPFFEELLNCHSKIDISLEDIETLTVQLLDWWDKDKHNLKDDSGPKLFGTPADEFRARFENLIQTLHKIILPNFKCDPDANNEIKLSIVRLIDELEGFDFNVLQLKVTGSALLNISDQQLALSIVKGILSKNKSSVVDACDALTYWVSLTNVQEQTTPLQTLTAKILFREPIRLAYCIQSTYMILKDVAVNQKKPISNAITSTLVILEEETRINERDSESLIADKLTIRKIACQYAFDFYNNGTFEAENKEQLIVWQRTATSDAEFNEIKRIWSEC
jgi:hypothetical protein